MCLLFAGNTHASTITSFKTCKRLTIKKRAPKWCGSMSRPLASLAPSKEQGDTSGTTKNCLVPIVSRNEIAPDIVHEGNYWRWRIKCYDV